MKIAELFIHLGIKGSENTTKAIGGVRAKLDEVRSSSLAVKAAVLGVFYGLQRMTAAAGAHGMGLQQFATLTGLSAQELQKWQYAGRQFGAEAEEVASSIKSVQQAMLNVATGQDAPAEFGLFAEAVELDPNKIRDTMYVMKKLQEFAMQTGGEMSDYGNRVMRAFGMSDGMIVAMRKNAFRDDIMKNAPVLSEKQNNSLAKVDVAWANMGAKIKHAMNQFTAKHGMEMIKGIDIVLPKIIKLAESLITLAEKVKIFEWIGKSFEGWAMMLDLVNTEIEEAKKGNNSPTMDAFRTFYQDFKNNIFGPDIVNENRKRNNITPKIKKDTSGKTSQIQIEQNLHFQDDGKEASKTASNWGKEIHNVFRQMPAAGQVS